MSGVKWIKLTTNMFDDEKIDFIESLPEADAILIIWVKLLTLAGKCNAGGYIFLTETIPYTEEMLAHKFRRKPNIVKLALETLSRLGMVEAIDGKILIANWEKHQNIDGMEKIRELARIRKQREREKKKLPLPKDMSRDCHVTSQSNHATELELDLDKDKEKEQTPYKKVVELYNSICTSLSKVKTATENRKKHIKARWSGDIDIFEELFTLAERSDFLTGRKPSDKNPNWKADFDWLINEHNMAKVLEGKYDNDKGGPPNGSNNRNSGSHNQQIRGSDAGKEIFPGYDRNKFEFPG